jgi:hypothetical protein
MGNARLHDMSIKSPKQVFSCSSTTDDKGQLSTSSHHSIEAQSKFGFRDNSSNTLQTNTSFNTKAFQETSLDLCSSAFSLPKPLPFWEHHGAAQNVQSDANGSSSYELFSQMNQSQLLNNSLLYMNHLQSVDTVDVHPSHTFPKESKLSKINFLQNIHKKNFISLLTKDQQNPSIQPSQEHNITDSNIADAQCIPHSMESSYGTPHSRSQTKETVESLEKELIMTPYKTNPSCDASKKKTIHQNNEPSSLSPSKTYQFLHRMKAFNNEQNSGENEYFHNRNIPEISLPNSTNTEPLFLKEHSHKSNNVLLEQKKQHINLSDTLLTETQLPLISPLDYLVSKGSLQPPTLSNTVYLKENAFYHDKSYTKTSKTPCNTTFSPQVLTSPRSNTISHFCTMVENYLHRL